MPTEIFNSASSAQPTSSWKVPDGVTRIFVECWGGGGGGGANVNNTANGGGGGGGGAYAASWLNVQPNSLYNYVVASASRSGTPAANLRGAGSASGSWFGSPTTVFARGGGGGGGNNAVQNYGGPGGNASESIGQWVWSGGSGGQCRVSTTGRGGSGGSSGGKQFLQLQYSGTGYRPYSISGSTGVPPGPTDSTTPVITPKPAYYAGPGGQGANVTSGTGFRPAGDPSGIGGGGGGGCSEGTGQWGAHGANGAVAITWIQQSPQVIFLDSQDELNP